MRPFDFNAWFKDALVQDAKITQEERAREHERWSRREFAATVRRDPTFYLNAERRRGSFEDKWHHFQLVGKPKDLGLINIATAQFFGMRF